MTADTLPPWLRVIGLSDHCLELRTLLAVIMSVGWPCKRNAKVVFTTKNSNRYERAPKGYGDGGALSADLGHIKEIQPISRFLILYEAACCFGFLLFADWLRVDSP
jgi:hypothetical protein